jgi:hypothetical protein
MPNPAWVGRLNSNVFLALSATFRWGLTGYAASDETGPLEKSAALYQKAPLATSAV